MRTITTIDLTFQSKNSIERIFWVAVAIFGVFIGFYCSIHVISAWTQNPTIITREHLTISDIDYPAISICSKGTHLAKNWEKNATKHVFYEIYYYNQFF